MAGAGKVFGVLMVTWTVGGWFDAYTLFFIAIVGAFSIPAAYDKNRALVDEKLAQAKKQLDEAIEKVKAQINKAPAAAKEAKGKDEAEKKKE